MIPYTFTKLPLDQMVRDMWRDERWEPTQAYAKLLTTTTEQFNPDDPRRMEKLRLPRVAPLFIGRSNVGKSYAAAILARWAEARIRHVFNASAGMAADQPARYVEWINCTLDLQFVDQFVTKVLPHYCNAAFLVLDEINGVRPNTYESKQLQAILHYRDGNELPTLITGNFEATTPEEMWSKVQALFDSGMGASMETRLKRMSEGYRQLFTE